MIFNLEYASFSLNEEHREDDVTVQEGGRHCLLAVVADGVSASDDGREASRFVVWAAREAFQRCYSSDAEGYGSFEEFLETFDYFLGPNGDCEPRSSQAMPHVSAEVQSTAIPPLGTGLAKAIGRTTIEETAPVDSEDAVATTPSAHVATSSEPREALAFYPRIEAIAPETTTSTGGALRQTRSAQTTATIVVFEPCSKNDRVIARYCAYGDSPIYRAFAEPIAPEYPKSFLVLQVHGKPLVTQGSRLYSYIDVANRRFVGRPTVGSFEMQSGDMCLLMTDGVPAREYIYRDIKDRANSHRFLNLVASKGAEKGARSLERWLKNDKALTDDATLVVVKVAEARAC